MRTEQYALALFRAQTALTEACDYLQQAGDLAPINSQKLACFSMVHRLALVLEGDDTIPEDTSLTEEAKCAIHSLSRSDLASVSAKASPVGGTQ